MMKKVKRKREKNFRFSGGVFCRAFQVDISVKISIFLYKKRRNLFLCFPPPGRVNSGGGISSNTQKMREIVRVFVQKKVRQREREKNSIKYKMKVSDRFFYLSFFSIQTDQVKYTQAQWTAEQSDGLSADIRYKVTIFLVCPRLEATQHTHIEKEIPDVSLCVCDCVQYFCLLSCASHHWNRTTLETILGWMSRLLFSSFLSSSSSILHR